MELPSVWKFITPPPMPYMSSRALKGLRDYKYVAGGYTFLDRVHTPYWNKIVEYFPLWLAPNLITLIGTGWLVLAYFVTSTFLPDLKGDAPRWVYALNGLAVFLYLHLDCLDGKQARRTGTSSPLGQLFDHGCDALAVFLIVAQIGGTLDAGPGPLGVTGTMAIMIPWIAAQWEEYHSGLMLYSNGTVGITELNYALVVLHSLTAAFGPGIWRVEIFDLLPVGPPGWLPKSVQHATTNELVIAGVVFGGIQQVYEVVSRVVSSQGSLMAKQDRGHKLLGSAEAWKQIAQFSLFFAVGAVFLSQRIVAPGQVAAVFATFGILYALQATNLIISHMAKEPLELFWWPFTLLAVNIANSHFQLVSPALFGWACAGVALGAYLHYVFSAIDQICGFLGIHCLTIPGPTDGAVEKEVAVGSRGTEGDAKDL